MDYLYFNVALNVYTNVINYTSLELLSNIGPYKTSFTFIFIHIAEAFIQTDLVTNEKNTIRTDSSKIENNIRHATRPNFNNKKRKCITADSRQYF